MRSERPKQKPGKPKGVPEQARPRDATERAQSLILRLETDGPNPIQAAEELDRLQPALERAETLAGIRERIVDLAAAWSEQPLRGDRARAWLVLAGGFGLAEHAERVAALVLDTGLPGPLRIAGSRVLPQLDRDLALDAMQQILLSNTDAQVRVAAAEALAELGDRATRPVLEALLDEDLPRSVWTAVSAALERIR